MSSSVTVLALLFLSSSATVFAEDRARLGDWYTDLPLYRSGSGTNVLALGIGTPEQNLNLTLTTNVEFIAVLTEECTSCVDDAEAFNTTESSTYDVTQTAIAYSQVYPIGSADTYLLDGTFGQEIISDERGDVNNARPVAWVTGLRQDTFGRAATTTGSTSQLNAGSSGFWGLGIFDPDASKSIMPSMLTVTDQGAPSDATSLTVGFDISNYTNTQHTQTGTVHWGAVPEGHYLGSFNWISVNTSVAAGWGFGVERIRVQSHVMDTSQYHGSIDPGFDSIYVPTKFAEEIYSKVDGALRDSADTTRWNLDCDANITMTVTISGREYNIAGSELVQPRDIAGRTCWGSIVAWQNGSVAERLGEIRLGTPFMSNVYSALYYTASERYIGLAGKPNSANLNVNKRADGKPNGKLAGILIGCLLGALVLLFLICYSRNRNSFQSIWYRNIRRQYRWQTNAFVRGATMPPAMIIPPVALGGPRPFGLPGMMGPMAPMGPMGPMGMSMPPSGMWGPPPYNPHMPPPQVPQQPPPQTQPVLYGAAAIPRQSQQQQNQQQQEQQQPLLQPQRHQQAQPPPHLHQQHQQMPPAVDPRPHGFYSPRQQLQDPRPVARFFAQVPGPTGRSPRHKQHANSAPPGQYGPPMLDQPGSMPPQYQPPMPLALPSGSKYHSAPLLGEFGGLLTKMPRRVPAMNGRTDQYDQWLRAYSGAGQAQQPYPDHKPPRIETRLSAPAPHALGGQPLHSAASGGGRKSPWGWMRKSRRDEYSPVNVNVTGARGWFRGGRTGWAKQNEYAREREAS